jgi:hypothetical protein
MGCLAFSLHPCSPGLLEIWVLLYIVLLTSILDLSVPSIAASALVLKSICSVKVPKRWDFCWERSFL